MTGPSNAISTAGGITSSQLGAAGTAGTESASSLQQMQDLIASCRSDMEYAGRHLTPNASAMRVFRGDETNQVHGTTGNAAHADYWYYEPEDYDGDTG